MRYKYHYERLKQDEIRLLELQNFPNDRHVIRRICSVPIAESPAYTAISYAWGQQFSTETVVCDDPDSYLPVTKNLESALRSVIRSKAAKLTHVHHNTKGNDTPLADQSLYIWVDAICINQNDVDEKNEQVSMMQEIYQRAKDVHIWLGDGNEGTEKAFDLIEKLVWASEQYPINQHRWSFEYMDSRERARFFGMTVGSEHGFDRASDALVDMLKRPWFTRVWIVQEVAVSKRARICYGDCSADWDDLVKAVKFSLAIRLRPSETFGRELTLRIAQTRDHYQGRSRGATSWNEWDQLQRLLFRHHDFSSTIPSDMIYALRGVANLPTLYQEHQSYLKYLGNIDLPSIVDYNDMVSVVDYRKSMEETYSELATHILSEAQNLDILGACTGPLQSSTLPSWVPDWSTSGTHTPLRHQGTDYEQYVKFSACSKYTQYSLHFHDSDGDDTEYYDYQDVRYLGLSGFILDTIKNVSLPPAIGSIPPGAMDGSIIGDLVRLYYASDSRMASAGHLLRPGLWQRWFTRTEKYFTGEDMYDVYRQTATAGAFKSEGFPALATLFRPRSKEGKATIKEALIDLPLGLFALFDLFHPKSKVGKSTVKDSSIKRRVWLLALSALSALVYCLDFLFGVLSAIVYRVLLFCTFQRRKAAKRQREADTFVTEKLVLIRSPHWKFATTRGGLIGLVPSEAKEGDKIGLFQGGKAPLVLRKADEEADLTNERDHDISIWKLIGECYVHGIIDGSAFDIGKCNDVWIS